MAKKRVREQLSPQDRAELYDRIVRQVEREDNLIDHRVTYTLTFQSILFAALAFTSRADEANVVATMMRQFAPAFGLCASSFGFLSVGAGFISIWQKLGGWRYYLRGADEYPSPTGKGISLFIAWISYIVFMGFFSCWMGLNLALLKWAANPSALEVY